MAVNYVADRPLRQDVDRPAVESALSAWLAERNAVLASGSYDAVRVDWRWREPGPGAFHARLALVDDTTHEDWVLHFALGDGSGRARLERTQISAADEVSPDRLRAPAAIQALLEVAKETGGLPEIIVSVDDPATAQQQKLVGELVAFCSGMATVKSATGGVVAAAAIGSRIACDGRPGSVVIVFSADDPPQVVPATVALRDPVATGKRVQQSLITKAPLSLAKRWADLEQALIAVSDGDVEAVLDQLASEQRELVDERQGLVQQVQTLQLQVFEMAMEAADFAEEVDGLRSRVRLFERELAKFNVYPTEGPAEDELELLPSTMSETVELARELLPQLLITASMEPVSKLDHHDATPGWAHTLWTIFRGMNDYAHVVAEGTWRGSLADYCRSTPTGMVGIPFKKVALNESEPTMNNPACRAARVFPVPEYISPDGQLVMFPHIKISRTSPAPRAHFLDRASEAGKLVIGYIGPHLPTAG